MARMKRLYLIGAGASCPYGLPTLKTLLWDLYKCVGREDQKVLEQAVYEACGVALEPCHSLALDFEEFLVRLDARLLYLKGNNSQWPRREAAAITLKGLRDFIRQRCLSAADREGPYDRLVQSLKEDQAIVSFNWDVLLEVAFHRAGRKYAYLRSRSPKDATLLLRPHGCISWFALLDNEGLSIDCTANVGVLGDDLGYYMLYLKHPLGERDWGKSSSLECALSPFPAIVPPTAAEVLSVGGTTGHWDVSLGHLEAMRAVWSTFKCLVAATDEIMAIGYSLPGTDAATIEVLRNFSGHVFIVDRNRHIVDRYRRIVSPHSTLVCDDFCKFEPEALICR